MLTKLNIDQKDRGQPKRPRLTKNTAVDPKDSGHPSVSTSTLAQIKDPRQRAYKLDAPRHGADY